MPAIETVNPNIGVNKTVIRKWVGLDLTGVVVNHEILVSRSRKADGTGNQVIFVAKPPTPTSNPNQATNSDADVSSTGLMTFSLTFGDMSSYTWQGDCIVTRTDTGATLSYTVDPTTLSYTVKVDLNANGIYTTDSPAVTVRCRQRMRYTHDNRITDADAQAAEPAGDYSAYLTTNRIDPRART